MENSCRLRRSLRRVESERGDVKELQGPLERYSRLRVGTFRIIFVRESRPKAPTRIRCLFAERRDTVYTVFSHMLKHDLLGQLSRRALARTRQDIAVDPDEGDGGSDGTRTRNNQIDSLGL